MTGAAAAQSCPIVSDDRVRDVLRRHVQRVLHVDRSFTRKQLADESGVNVHTIDAIVSRDAGKNRRVCFADGISLAWVMGPPAVNALLGLIGWVGRPEDDGEAVNPMAIAATSMGHLAVIAAAAADGRIDHTELPATQQAADLLIATVLPLSSGAMPP